MPDRAEAIKRLYDEEKLDYDAAMRAMAVLYHDTSSRSRRREITTIAEQIERAEETKAGVQ